VMCTQVYHHGHLGARLGERTALHFRDSQPPVSEAVATAVPN